MVLNQVLKVLFYEMNRFKKIMIFLWVGIIFYELSVILLTVHESMLNIAF